MKKLITSILACGLILSFSNIASAALLEDWSYELQSVQIANVNTNLITQTGNDYSWDGGKYNNTITPAVLDPTHTSGSFSFAGQPAEVGVVRINPESVLNQSTDAGIENTGFGTQPLMDLVFNFTVTSDGYTDDTNGVSFDLQYVIPLQTYFDPTTGNEFVFYNVAEAMYIGGGNEIGFEDYHYYVSPISLSVDGRSLSSNSTEDGTYRGWLINEETRTNLYTQYILGEDNSSYINGTKASEGLFGITGAMTVSYTKTTDTPAPTPEPATMLLTGLGLAGLGFMRRRKNS